MQHSNEEELVVNFPSWKLVPNFPKVPAHFIVVLHAYLIVLHEMFDKCYILYDYIFQVSIP